MACSVLLAALSILPYDGQTGGRSEADAELDKERSMRMATILGFAVDAKRDARWECILRNTDIGFCSAAGMPDCAAREQPLCVHQAANTSVRMVGPEACAWPPLRCCLRHACRNVLARTALVGELASKGVGNLVPDEIKQILTLLEGDFVPLELCHRLQPLLETLGGLSKPMSGGLSLQLSGGSLLGQCALATAGAAAEDGGSTEAQIRLDLHERGEPIGVPKSRAASDPQIHGRAVKPHSI